MGAPPFPQHSLFCYSDGMKRNHYPLASVWMVVIAAGGCSPAVTIPFWQKSVETYVKEEGGGDPGVLRNMMWKGTHHGFSVISKNYPGASTDANGILLAHQMIADKPWFIFLVGLMQKQKVTDIRAAALSVEGGQFNWRVSGKDDSALKAYRNYNNKLWHDRFPGREDAPPEYLGFPREADVFDLNRNGDEVQVTHPPSGAQWEVKLSTAKH
jgi:hypothetical protein